MRKPPPSHEHIREVQEDARAPELHLPLWLNGSWGTLECGPLLVCWVNWAAMEEPCIPYFTHFPDKVLGQKQLNGGRVYLGLHFEGPLW